MKHYTPTRAAKQMVYWYGLIALDKGREELSEALDERLTQGQAERIEHFIKIELQRLKERWGL